MPHHLVGNARVAVYLAALAESDNAVAEGIVMDTWKYL